MKRNAVPPGYEAAGYNEGNTNTCRQCESNPDSPVVKPVAQLTYWGTTFHNFNCGNKVPPPQRSLHNATDVSSCYQTRDVASFQLCMATNIQVVFLLHSDAV